MGQKQTFGRSSAPGSAAAKIFAPTVPRPALVANALASLRVALLTKRRIRGSVVQRSLVWEMSVQIIFVSIGK
jgi:hypothetical protein